jgi:hypothetical protein
MLWSFGEAMKVFYLKPFQGTAEVYCRNASSKIFARTLPKIDHLDALPCISMHFVVASQSCPKGLILLGFLKDKRQTAS